MGHETATAWALSLIFANAEWTPQGLESAAVKSFGWRKSRGWLGRLAAEVVEAAALPYAPAPATIARLILAAGSFRALELDDEKDPLFDSFSVPLPGFAPAPPFRDAGIPEMETVSALAAWLNLPARHVEWLADVEGYRAAADSRSTRHYVRSWVPRRHGPPRLIEAPKPLLKGIQQRILREILDPIPVHDAAHGFRKGRSCIGGAARHAGEHVVLCLDLKDFFPTVPIRAVHGLFRSLGYPWPVARILAGLCSTRTPPDVFDALPFGAFATSPPDRATDRDWRASFGGRHLPQGAPTSPALANLCAWRLDCRLAGLARRAGAAYTRYADDLTFSGDADFARRAGGFVRAASEICADAGFPVHADKTRIMHRHKCQRVTGIVVNRHVNLPRADYDNLKAILTNCIRRGPATQNRDGAPDFRAHLEGRVAWAEHVNRARGEKLRVLFERIARG